MEPTQKAKTTAKDFFFYLGTIILLYVSFGSLLTLLFNYINFYFPDALSGRYGFDPYGPAIRYSLAILIILFPVFWAATWHLNKDLRANPEKQDMNIRKWLLYLTVFAALGIVIGDLVVLVNTFLNGEITTRFVLKVLTVLVMSGLALYYYWSDIKGRFIENPTLGRALGIAAAVIVAASVVGGFFITGSPQSQRLIRFDQQKVNDLQNIQSQIVYFWQLKQKLPQTLAELNDPLSGVIIPIDAQNNTSYEYSATGNMTFKICAVFNKESTLTQAAGQVRAPTVPMKGDGFIEDNWKHGIGNTCFDRTIDPERYPPIPANRAKI